MRIGRFLEIERYEQSKYHGLDKSNKHFKEIEWDQEYVSKWQACRSDLCGDPEHDSEKDCSGKDIPKETEW